MMSVQNLDKVSEAEAAAPNNNETDPPNIIHVTLEASSMKQLIKLSKDLVPQTQITTEIEAQGVQAAAAQELKHAPFLKIPSGSPRSYNTDMTK